MNITGYDLKPGVTYICRDDSKVVLVDRHGWLEGGVFAYSSESDTGNLVMPGTDHDKDIVGLAKITS